MTSIGPAGRQVAANLDRLRGEQHLSLRAVSERLGDLGRPMLPSALHAIGRLTRRVDADDIAALAEVLGVTPARLLMPPELGAAQDHQAVRAALALAGRLTALITADSPETAASARARAGMALRRLQLEAEELLDVTGGQP